MEILDIGDPIYNEKLYKYTTPEEKNTFVDGLNTYYTMKNDYEKSIQKEKNLILKRSLGTQKTRRLFKEFVPKCINCKQPGGTIFTEKFVETEGFGNRVAKAKCGNQRTPCPLDIVINLGVIKNIETELEKEKKDSEKIKSSIIENKNDIIFGLVSEKQALEVFEQLKEMANTSGLSVELLSRLYADQVDNTARTNMIENLRKDIVDDIFYIKNYMKDFNNTEKLEFVRDAVEMYVENLYVNNIPDSKKTNVMKKYRKLEWPINMIEYNDETDTFVLKQMHHNPESLEFNFSDKFGVEKMVIGLGKLVKKKKTNKTIKRVGSEKPNAKTRKVKPLIIEEDSEVEVENVNENENESVGDNLTGGGESEGEPITDIFVNGDGSGSENIVVEQQEDVENTTEYAPDL